MTLILGVSLGSLLILGFASWLQFRRIYRDQLFERLTSVRASKGYEVEAYVHDLRSHIETLSRDRMMIAAMVELNSAYRSLQNEAIPPEQSASLERYYDQTFLPKLSELSQSVQLYENYRPTTQAGEYLQYQYIANEARPAGERQELDVADDRSEYSQIHQEYQPILRNLIVEFGYRDLYLIDFNSGDIIYSVAKQPDFATNLDRGPHRRSSLATLVEAVRENPRQGFVEVVDFKPYAPAELMPVAFFAAPIYNGPHIVGILACQIDASQLTKILSSHKNWSQDGLGKTGQVYLVGEDSLMRSDARSLIEDPKTYREQLSQAGLSAATITLVEKLNTSVLLQPVETQAVSAAFEGNVDTQVVRDERNQAVFSAYAPLKLTGLNWAILAELDRSEALQPIDNLQLYMGLVSLIVILLVTGLAEVVANKAVKPVLTLLTQARQITETQAPTEIKLDREDELGRLAAIVDRLAKDLHQKAMQVAQSHQTKAEILHNFLPEDVASRRQRGETDISHIVQQVTILAAQIHGISELMHDRSFETVTALLNQLFDGLNQHAHPHGIEVHHTFNEDIIAVCGLSRTYLDRSKRVMGFAIEMLRTVESICQEYQVNLSLGIGIHTGPLVGAAIGTDRFHYKIWGETVRVALALREQAQPNQILVTSSTQESLKDQYAFRKVQATHPSAFSESLDETEIWEFAIAQPVMS